MATRFLRDHPDLRRFPLSSAGPTGRIIECGSYGSVEEVAVLGTLCAAKKIHDYCQDPRQIPRENMEQVGRSFVKECQLMSTLRHPHIVQFMGVCFLPFFFPTQLAADADAGHGKAGDQSPRCSGSRASSALCPCFFETVHPSRRGSRAHLPAWPISTNHPPRLVSQKRATDRREGGQDSGSWHGSHCSATASLHHD